MIDLELERKAFNDWHFLTYGEFVNWWDDAPASWIHNDRWKGWISSAESKQAEIDSLKACRSDFEIIQQTIALVDLLATSTNVYQRDPSCLYPFESENPRVKEWWRTACKIQELLTNTDPENCDFDEYKKMIEAAQGEQNEY